MIIIAVLVIVVSFLTLKLCLVKQQMRKIVKQLEEQGENFISVDFVDRDLETMALKINENLDLIQKIKAEAVKGEQAMKSSISMISHDMRTPLTSVIGYLQLAEKNCQEKETLQDIRIALDRAKYSNKLVDDFFELSVIDSNQYTPVMEKVNICEVVCEEILANYLEFEKKGITPLFEQADDVIDVWADRKLLIRVIQNLISNGIKYSTGKMEFSVIQDDKVVFSISNSISQSIDVEKIFDKFYRADASRNSEGMGLGLYICRKFIEEIQGNISAYSNGDMLTIKVELNPFLL
ncbi:MAG: HAMP domain-containing sensor histidine kinase [Clostridiales bacterium]|nr:HAMP domain-containing sensor histidine kinase [Clostridiales bacterium]